MTRRAPTPRHGLVQGLGAVGVPSFTPRDHPEDELALHNLRTVRRPDCPVCPCGTYDRPVSLGGVCRELTDDTLVSWCTPRHTRGGRPDSGRPPRDFITRRHILAPQSGRGRTAMPRTAPPLAPVPVRAGSSGAEPGS